MISLLAQTTRPIVWTPEGFVLVLTCIALVVLPAATVFFVKVIAAITELKKVAVAANTKADMQGAAIVQLREKVNEVAVKNPADIDPLAPMPVCPPEPK